MRNTIALAVAALLLAACTEDFTPQSSQQEITCSAFTVEPTRAITKGTEFKTETIFVTSNYTNPTTGNNSVYFKNEKFVLKDGKWAGVSPLYWPIEGSLDFVAYAVDGMETGVSGVSEFAKVKEEEDEDASTLTLDFAGSPLNGEHDVMVAYKNDVECPGSTVPLQFSHSQAMLTFIVHDGTGTNSVRVSSIKLKDCLLTGKVVADLKGERPVFTWTSQPENDKVSVPQNGDSSVEGEFGSILAIPVTGMKAFTSLDISFKANIKDEYAGEKTVTWQVPNDLTWEAGKKYVYNITITPDKVVISLSLIDWNQVGDGENLEIGPLFYINVGGEMGGNEKYD